MQHPPTPIPAAEAQRHAYNVAFEELGLNWQWDESTFESLVNQPQAALRAFLEREHPHLLRAYEADFLVQAVETAKARAAQSR